MSHRELGKTFVTGACGFIGSHLVERLVEEGVEVTALCLYNSFGSFGWLDECATKRPKNLKIVLGDVRDKYQMDNCIKGHSTVFHLASLIAIPYSYHAPQSYFDTNVYGALNVAQASLQHKVDRVVHTSTSEVYGTARYVPIDEAHPLQGQSPYSASKISADMLMDSFYRSFGLPVVTLRPFNTYGPRQSFRAVIPTVIGQILSGETRLKLGNITPTRDFNFVDDTVNAFTALATQQGDVLGDVFNGGSGTEVTIGETVAMIAKLLKADVTIETDDVRVRPNLSEVERLLCNADKLKNKTGWHQKTKLEQGLRLTIEWMRKNASYIRSRDYQM